MSDKARQFIPNFCRIPDFGDLEPCLIVRVTARAFVDQLAPELSAWRDRQLFLNLVRLTDRVVVNFTIARTDLEDYIAHRHEGRVSTLFSAVSHMEAGLTALDRCFDFAVALMRSPDAPAIEKGELPSKDIREKVRKLRNAIEHTDGSLKSGALSEGMAMLHILDDRLELEEITVLWPELELAVRMIHALSKRLIEFVPSQ